MMTHMSAMCRAIYYQLQQLHPLICSLSFDADKLLVQAFISTCLDYCNSLVTTVRDQRKPVPMPTSHSKCCSMPHHQHEKVRAHHTCPALATLASVCQRHVFKIAVLVYKALHDQVPVYLAEDCQLVSVTGLPTTVFVGHRHVPSSVALRGC